MRVVMPLAKTQPLRDAALILNFQIKYPLLDKLRFFKNAQNFFQSPLLGVARKRAHAAYGGVWGEPAQACSKRRGESANINGLLEQYPNGLHILQFHTFCYDLIYVIADFAKIAVYLLVRNSNDCQSIFAKNFCSVLVPFHCIFGTVLHAV